MAGYIDITSGSELRITPRLLKIEKANFFLFFFIIYILLSICHIKYNT